MTGTTEDRNLKRRIFAASGLSIIAGLIHGLVTPDHFKEWWGYGLFFFTATFVQVGYGALFLLKPWAYDETGGERNDALSDYDTIRYCFVGIAGTLSIIAVWIVTRTVGLPFLGPEVGKVESITGISLVSKVIEGVLIVCLVFIIRQIKAQSRNRLAMS